jgi:hypothetical protein
MIFERSPNVDRILRGEKRLADLGGNVLAGSPADFSST